MSASGTVRKQNPHINSEEACLNRGNIRTCLWSLHSFAECYITTKSDVCLLGSALQNYQFGGMVLENCTNVDLHGPYEQTYTNGQLDFAQGKIVEVNEDELTYTVEVRSRLVTCIQLLGAI